MGETRFVGQRLRRKEDGRFLRGTARYLPDLRMADVLDVAFVRSTESHALVRSVDVEPALGLPGVAGVLTLEELKKFSKPFTPNISPPGFKQFSWHALADERVRYVGEPVAVVAAVDRYVAEDAAALVTVDYEPLAPVTTAEAALDPSAPLLYPEWGDNLVFTKCFSHGDMDGAFREAMVIRERFQSQRHSGAPMEGRGCLATVDPGTGKLSVWSSTQWPHPLRTVLADLLGLPESSVEVTAPDVGGGFGNKQHMFREELAVCVLAMKLGRPVRWVEDRWENLTASVHAREQVHEVEAAVSSDGVILALKARVTADLGDASTYFVGISPQLVTVSAMTGPYRIPNYSYELRCVVTNKCPSGAYRGFGRSTAALTIERLMDIVAERTGLDPAEVRRRNLLREDELPYRTAAGGILDSGRYHECLDLALAHGDYARWRKEQAALRDEGRHIGIGLACIVEGTGPSVRGSTGRFGAYDAATARLEPDGRLSVYVGVCPQGQGHATVLAQVAADQLGTTPADVDIFHGNTATSPYGLGAFGGRGAAIGGASVIKAVRRVRSKVLAIAAGRLGATPEELEISAGRVRVRNDDASALTIVDVARMAYHDVHLLPEGMDPGVQFTSWYQPPLVEATPDAQGRMNNYAAASNATHLVVVEVHTETGQLSILQYTVVHDCGTVINPMIVEGQVHGGVAQGIGGALLEEMVYDSSGQFISGSFMDYLLPTATDVPHIDVHHIETPTPFIEGGFKAAGEGGTIGAPAALANAVADALAPFGVAIRGTPLSPSRLLSLLSTQRRARPSVAAPVADENAIEGQV
jgi:carbon-monoxide dehydrogenase large subunit